MNEDTRFLLRRMDQMEKKLMKEILLLRSFRDKILGLVAGISVVVSASVEIVLRKLF